MWLPSLPSVAVVGCKAGILLKAPMLSGQALPADAGARDNGFPMTT